MSKSCIILATVTSIFLLSCASPTVVQSVKPGDSGLSCSQLQNEYADAEKFKKEAEGEKGVTGGNVARILFWPAIVGTYMNANEAIAAAENRKVHIVNQLNQKGCATPETAQAAVKASEPEQAIATNPQSKEAKLSELKRLYDANLITKEAYAERQKAILDSQ